MTDGTPNASSTPADAPRVSVVTIYHNREAFVDESIASVLNQKGVPFELVAVDDGSMDGTLARLRAIRDPRLRVLSKPNSGFVDSIRQAIAATRGCYVAVHGSGDLSLPGRLLRQSATLDALPEVGIVGCHVARGHRNAAAPFASPNGLPFTKALIRTNLFTHGEVMFRRALYDLCGGYRTFFRFSQDRDLWLRMSHHCSYRVVEEVLYRKEQRAGGVSRSAEKVLLQKRLSEFAVQCAEAVEAGGADLLDRYGEHAPMMMRRSPRLARSLLRDGARFLVHNNDPTGWMLIEAALAESRDLRVLMSAALLSTHRRRGLFDYLVRPALQRLNGAQSANT